MDLDTEKDNFLRELSQIMDEYFSEPSYPTKLKEHTKQMIHYLLPDHGYAAL